MREGRVEEQGRGSGTPVGDLLRRPWLVLALGAVAMLMSHCKKGGEPDKKRSPGIAAKKVVSRKKATVKSSPAGKSLWDDKCSSCHELKEMKGKGMAEIKAAVKNIEGMKYLADELKEADYKALAELLTVSRKEEKKALTTARKAATKKKKKQYAFLAARVCSGCHRDKHRLWRHSLHAKAHFEPVYDRYFIKAVQENNKLQTYCGRCHTPLAVLDKAIPFKKPVRRPGDTKVNAIHNDGVQCDFCHIVNGYKKLNNAGWTVERSLKKRGPLKDAKSVFHPSVYSNFHKKAEFCGTCHDVVHPTNGILLEGTYSEWKKSPYAKEGVRCQDCHMTFGLVRKKLHPGKAAIMGRKRKHVARHFFVGPNMMFSDKEGSRLKSLRLKLLRKAGKVEIIRARRRGRRLRLTIKTSNVGAGHYLPTGITELRQLWLEVKVTDRSGKLLYHSGGLTRDKRIKPGAVVFRTDVKDKTGKVTTRFWAAVKKSFDRRIPPRSSLKDRYKIRLPRRSKGPLKVEVKLNYRSLSPAGLKEVGAPENLVKIPVITIAETEASIKG